MGLQPQKFFRRAMTGVAAATLLFNSFSLASMTSRSGDNIVLAESAPQDAAQQSANQPQSAVRPEPAQPGLRREDTRLVHKVLPGQTLFSIAAQYATSVNALAAVNGLANPNRIKAGQLLLIPSGAASDRKQLASRSLGLRGRVGLALIRPVQSRISSKFGQRWGRMHYGIDFATPAGTLIVAAAGGTVVFSGWRSGYGRLIILDHGDGVQTYYAHNSERLVGAGVRVNQGQAIARAGSSGSTTGPNLHFEVRVNGEAVDPLGFLP
ncbi:MAG: peptidoglycan DD-metalloendopeptidase family protein [Firmicutes bacterium]|nr:peptidoglycan DD-metalloendopeptidase family protein [Bacillota bacterium]